MTQNKMTVQRYLEGFRQSNSEQILACLTDDVEWKIPGGFEIRGKEEFGKHIIEPGFKPHPQITISRLIEEADVVVAEGSVRTEKTDDTVIKLAFCDVFEMHKGKIRRLTSYLMPIK